MRLKVNGVEVRVVDKIEIILEIPEDGDTLINGVSVHIKGGSFTINNPPERAHCIVLKYDKRLILEANYPLGFEPTPEWFGIALEGPPT